MESASIKRSCNAKRDCTATHVSERLSRSGCRDYRGLKREQKLTDDQRVTIAKLKKKLDVSEGALRAFFRTLGEADIPVEQLEARLVAIAEHFMRVRDQLIAAPDDEPEIAKLKNEARVALEAGELERADALLEGLNMVAITASITTLALAARHLPEPADFHVFRDIDAPWCPEMVVLPAGEFMMGSPESEKVAASANDRSTVWRLAIGSRLGAVL